MVKIYTVTFVLKCNNKIFLPEYAKALPTFLKNVIISRSRPKFEEYIRIVCGTEMRLEFFLFPEGCSVSKLHSKVRHFIEGQRRGQVIYVSERFKENVNINCFIAYYIVREILKKFGQRLKNRKVGIVGLERAKKIGLLYEIAESVDFLYTSYSSFREIKIADELLGEFGTVVINCCEEERVFEASDLVFAFKQMNTGSFTPEKGIICYPEEGVVKDFEFLRKTFFVSQVCVDFLPLKDICLYNIMPFVDLPVNLVEVICEKLLFTTINNFSDAKKIFTKDLFDVKIKLK